MAICEACGKPRPRKAERFCSPACYAANRPRRAPESRFWAKVRKSPGCWEWTGGRQAGGYGAFGADPYHPSTAHRYSWELHFGPIPAGMWVLHRCDNPPCVRPDHLFLGTPWDNTHDAMTKARLKPPPWTTNGRVSPIRGERNPHAKLTQEQVDEIRKSFPGQRQRDIARRFGVSQTLVWNILHRRTWT